MFFQARRSAHSFILGLAERMSMPLSKRQKCIEHAYYACYYILMEATGYILYRYDGWDAWNGVDYWD